MPFRPKSLTDCMERYGKFRRLPDGRYQWPNDADWVKACYLPAGIEKHLINTANKRPVERIFCNIDMHDPLIEAFENVLQSGVEQELRTFDGCYNVRFVRGSDSVFSLHSWALAIDLNAKENPLGARSTWSDAFVRCFTDAGFVWGGDFKTRLDAQHFQWFGTPRQAITLSS